MTGTQAEVRDDGKVRVTFPVHDGKSLTVTITRATAEKAARDPKATRALLDRWRQL